MTIIRFWISMITAAGLTLYLLPRLLEILEANGRVVRNYAGREVVTGGGMVFFFPCILGILPFIIVNEIVDYFAYLFVVVSLLMLGLVDDFLGDRQIKGLRGHIGALLQGKLSTGGLKALGGGMVGLLVTIPYQHSLVEWGIKAVVFALSVNFINLLDLRPGRAIKGFLFYGLPLILLGGFSCLWIITPITVSLLVYWQSEMGERCMLGDAGANLLGGILGFLAINVLELSSLWVVLLILTGIHLISEFYSLSRIINGVALLRYIDRFGSLKKGEKYQP